MTTANQTSNAPPAHSTVFDGKRLFELASAVGVACTLIFHEVLSDGGGVPPRADAAEGYLQPN